MNLNAKESFGWAARSMKYRSAAFLEMSEIYLVKKILILLLNMLKNQSTLTRKTLKLEKLWLFLID